MEIEVNIGKKEAFFLIAGLIFFFGTIFVIAYNPSFSGGNALVFGHSADEVNVKLNGEVNTTQNFFDTLVGKAECKIDSNELKTKGCPQNSYLYKVNAVGDSYCKRYFSRNIVNPVVWCYPESHSTTSTECVKQTYCLNGGNTCCFGNLGMECCQRNPQRIYVCDINAEGKLDWRLTNKDVCT